MPPGQKAKLKSALARKRNKKKGTPAHHARLVRVDATALFLNRISVAAFGLTSTLTLLTKCQNGSPRAPGLPIEPSPGEIRSYWRERSGSLAFKLSGYL